MTSNETIVNNTLDMVSVKHKRYEDFSMVPMGWLAYDYQ